LPAWRTFRLGRRVPAHQCGHRTRLRADHRHEPGNLCRGGASPHLAGAHLDQLRWDAARPGGNPDGAQGPVGRSGAGWLLELHGRCRLPGAHPLPRARAGHRQLQDRSAGQEGPVVQRGDQRAHGARLQPRLRPEVDHARRDGDRLPGRDHDPVALRAHGPGLCLRQPPRLDDVRRRAARHHRAARRTGSVFRDR